MNILEFSRLSKGLAVILVLGYLLTLFLPWTVDYLALVPARTIPFVWNIFTAGFLERSVYGLMVSSLGLLYGGKLLEPVWTSREFLKFIIFVNVFTLSAVYGTAIFLYYITTRTRYLYLPLSGFYGVLSGFLVGVKQVIPEHEIMALGSFHLRAEWLPSLFVLIFTILSFLISEVTQYLPFVLFGTYGGWLYIRYLQRDPHVNYVGYPVKEFSFSTFFPPFIRPVIDIPTSGLHKLLCQERAHARDDHASDSTLPVSTAEATRWRERGARALDSRLQADKMDGSADKNDEASAV